MFMRAGGSLGGRMAFCYIFPYFAFTILYSTLSRGSWWWDLKKRAFFPSLSLSCSCSCVSLSFLSNLPARIYLVCFASFRFFLSSILCLAYIVYKFCVFYQVGSSHSGWNTLDSPLRHCTRRLYMCMKYHSQCFWSLDFGGFDWRSVVSSRFAPGGEGWRSFRSGLANHAMDSEGGWIAELSIRGGGGEDIKYVCIIILCM